MLIEKEQLKEFDNAIAIATTQKFVAYISHTNNEYCPCQAHKIYCDLLTALVRANQTQIFPLAYETALQLFDALDKNNPNYVSSDFYDESDLYSEYGLKILKALIEKNYNIQQIIDLANKMVSSALNKAEGKDQEIHTLIVCHIFESLIAHNQGLDAALNAAKMLSDRGHWQKARDLFMALATKNYGLNEAVAFATKLVQAIKHKTGYLSTDTLRLTDVYNLFEILLTKNYGVSEAITLAQQTIEDNIKSNSTSSYKSYDDTKESLKLLKTVVTEASLHKNDSYITTITQLAQKYLNCDDTSTQFDALKLFNALFEKGCGITEAIDIIENKDKTYPTWITQQLGLLITPAIKSTEYKPTN